MKRFIVILGVLLVFGSSASAQIDGGQQGHMGHDMMGDKMMSMCRQMMGESMPMMRHMMGHGMAMQDTMHMMMDILKMQRKMLRGMGEAEKKEAMKDIEKMMERLEKMMSEMRGMMRGGMMHMMPAEPKKGEQKENPPVKESPKAEPHKH